MLVGLLLIWLIDVNLNSPPGKYFDLGNIRMIVTASSALDIYKHFLHAIP